MQSDPLAKRDERRLVRHMRHEPAGFSTARRRGYDRVIGTSGTILSLGAIAAGDGRAVTGDRRNRRVAAKPLHRLRKRLVALALDKRLRLPGLDPRRADLVGGRRGPARHDRAAARRREITLCDFSLREGLVLDYIQRNGAHPPGATAIRTSGAAA